MPEHQTETPRPETRGQLIHWAANYDRMVTVLTLGREGRFRRRILDAARLAPGGRVLDVGCGTGTLALLAAETVGSDGRVDGIDPSPEMIARARSKVDRSGQSVHFQEAGIESLPFPDRSFDAVLSSLMFHHLDSSLQEAGLREILRVLAPGGRLLLLEHIASGRPRTFRWQQRVDPLWHHLACGCHLTRPTPDTLRDAGFNLSDTQVFQHRKLPGLMAELLQGSARRAD